MNDGVYLLYIDGVLGGYGSEDSGTCTVCNIRMPLYSTINAFPQYVYLLLDICSFGEAVNKSRDLA